MPPPSPVPIRRRRTVASWAAAIALAMLAAATAGAGGPAPGAVHATAVMRSDADPCGWHAAAVRLAGSLEGETGPRAQRLRNALDRHGIASDSPPPDGCRQSEQDPGPVDAGPEPAGGAGRIAVAADGNQHDQDDWASAPMTLAILAQRGLQPDLVNYTYNNHIWDSDPTHRENMTESVLGAAERFGFDTSVFFDAAAPDGLAAGVADLTADINASGPDDELWLVLAGPMETAWMALDAADPEARKSVKCVSHGDGTFNQTHGQTDHGGHTYDDVIELGCQRVQIPNQNGNLGPTDMSDWSHLRDAGDPDMEWLYSRLELAEKGDVSDAGMVYFVITGDEEGTRADLRSLLTDTQTEPPAARTSEPESAAPQRRAKPDSRQLSPVEVSPDGHFLQFTDGRPFFWLADTGWEMFHRASREDARLYLDTRAEQGFTVIQAVALAEKGGLDVPTPAGHTPLVGGDPANPDVREGPDNDYWDDVDYMIDYANSKGMYVALWAAWGSMVHDGPEVLDTSNARAYGEFLGARYGEKDVFFVLGGDRESNAGANTPEVWSELAAGIRATDPVGRLISYHPWGEESSTEMFPNSSDVIDFNLIQGSHKKVSFEELTTLLVADYGKTPTKPVIDSEVFYEEHPFNWNVEEGWKTAVHARGAAYYQVFSGAAGHTYGDGAVHQFWEPGMDAPYEVRDPWQDAIHHEGATQMQHLKTLMLSRSYFDRVPDQSLITSGTGRATRSESGSWAMVYLPEGGSVGVDTSALASTTPQVTWFNPRTGESQADQGSGRYTAPDAKDWVLILDAPA